jgi:hypothetical protein
MGALRNGLTACQFLILALPAWAGDFTPHLDLDLRLDPAKRTLAAEATLRFLGPDLVFRLAPGLTITRRELDGRPLPNSETDSLRVNASGPGPHTLRLAYQGNLAPMRALDHRQVLDRLPPMADVGGSFLPAGTGWYPDPGEPFSYRLRLALPPGQKGLVPGTLVREEDTRKGKAPGYIAEYAFPQAAEGIDLMAGPYQMQERLVSRAGQTPLRLRTWFYPDLAELAAGYLEDSARYIERYSRLIGPYPFDAFSVVAAPLPTGFGMPSLTYLGRDVLRLPFIRATSLGHEVLHNWWGNGVIPDWSKGNWSEGLTSFLADYAYKEDQSEEAAREMRLSWLRNLAAVPASEDTPLAAFTARHHGISSIVGYDKAAMVFFMLRDEIGTEAFHQGLRLFWQRHRFRRAGWSDLEHSFSEAAGRDLSDFFRQWVDQAGAPSLKLAEARWTPGSLQLQLEQTGQPYHLKVPLNLLVFPNQTETRRLDIKEPSTQANLPAPQLVQAVDLDPDYRLWRRLDAENFPPTLREVFVSPHVGLMLAVADDRQGQAATALAERLLDAKPESVRAEGPGLPGQYPMLIVGQTDRVNTLLSRLGLPPSPPQVNGKGTGRAWTARDETGRVYAVVSGQDAEALAAMQRPLPHYGRQSWLVFDAAKALDKGIWPARIERLRVKTPNFLWPTAPGASQKP